jgi:hypothetical protein
MTPADRKRFSECFLAIAEIYGRAISQPLVQIFWNALLRFDIEAVESAFQRHICDPDRGQYSPKPADIIRLLEGSADDVAMAAWTKLNHAMRNKYTGFIAFDDPLIHIVTYDMGGIDTLLEEQRATHLQMAEFCARYKSYKNSSTVPQYPAFLSFRCPCEDAPLRYVGDKTKVMAVIAGGASRRPEIVARLIDNLVGTEKRAALGAPPNTAEQDRSVAETRMEHRDA